MTTTTFWRQPAICNLTKVTQSVQSNLCKKALYFVSLDNIDILNAFSFSSSESSKFDSGTISITCYIRPYVNPHGADSFCLCHKYVFPFSEAKQLHHKKLYFNNMEPTRIQYLLWTISINQCQILYFKYFKSI